MNTTADVVAEMPIDVPAKTVAAKPWWETLRWSVQRELWENRSIYIAPLAVAGFILLGMFISMARHPEALALLAAIKHDDGSSTMALPFSITAAMVIFTSMLVAFFYCLDAMYSERRDRSILFWKSLPVSDGMTVISKLCLPVIVLPVVTFVVILLMHILFLLLGSVLMLVHGMNAGVLWQHLPLFRFDAVVAWGMFTMAVWYVTVWGWVFLVSSWAKRAPLLWALMPWVIAAIVEKIAFGTTYVIEVVKSRLTGFFDAGFALDTEQRSGGARHSGGLIPVSAISPGHFLMTPGLWIGLVFAAMFFVGVVQMRRYREPI